MSPRPPILLIALLSCSEAGFTPLDDVARPDDDTGVVPDPDDDTDPPPPEPCEVAPAPAGPAAIDEDCKQASLVVDDPWNLRIKWQYSVPTGSGSYVMPVVGNLTDDNGDGRIDGDDQPEVVFTSLSGAVIALRGDGSGAMWTLSGMNGNAGLTLADVDRDGIPEVIALTSGNEVVAIRPDGTIKWRSPAIAGLQMYPQPAVGDLDGDGTIEIVMDRAIVAGANGALIRTLPDPGVSWRAPVIADLDADGRAEILLGRHAFNLDGTIKFSVGPSSNGDSCFAAVADIDGDIGGESFWVWGGSMYVVDHDGRPIRTVALPGNPFRPGPPAIADFDGDGDVEIVVPMNTRIGMFEIDGTLRWSQTMQDNSGIAGVSGYDVDGDGAYEAIFADEVAMRIYDGRSGTIRYENFSHSSGTVWEYPIIADVDNDGSAEIVIASQGSVWKGVTVFEHAGAGWAEAGPTWPTHDFAVSNINADLSVPSPIPLPWTTHNVFRARPVVDQFAVDLRVQITDVCVTDCVFESQVQVAIQVYNTGALPVPPGVPVALYSARGAGRVLIDTWTTPSEVPAGALMAGHVFTLTAGQLDPEGLIVVVDDDGTGAGIVYECREDNNEDRWGPSPCE